MKCARHRALLVVCLVVLLVIACGGQGGQAGTSPRGDGPPSAQQQPESGGGRGGDREGPSAPTGSRDQARAPQRGGAGTAGQTRPTSVAEGLKAIQTAAPQAALPAASGTQVALSEAVSAAQTAAIAAGNAASGGDSAASGDADSVASAVESMLAFADVSNLEELDSYRASHLTKWHWENGETGTTDVLTEFVRSPLAQRIVVKGSNAPDAQAEFIYVDGTSYVGSGGRWVAMQTESDDFTQQMGWWGGPETLLVAATGEFVGKETVNGVETKRYRFDEQDLDLSNDMMTIEEYSADVWVSIRDTVYIKVLIHWVGVEENLGRGTFDMESNLLEFNTPITIQAPEGVAKPEVPSDIPLAPGATEVTTVGNVTSYKVAMEASQVVDFYKTEMPAQGWALASPDTSLMLRFTKGDRVANIVAAGQAGSSSVTIFSGAQ